MSRRSAYTLIESLVCVFVVALLSGVLLMSLRAVRTDMTYTKDLMNMGLTSKDFYAYASDHSGQLPNAGLPSEAEAAPWFYLRPSSELYRATRYLSHDSFWPLVLYNWSGKTHHHWHASSGPAWSAGHRPYEWEDVEPRLRAWMPSAFEYGLTMITAPELWSVDAPGVSGFLELVPHYRANGLEQVASPSAKGLLLCRSGARSLTHWLAAFADGHVEEKQISAFREAAMYPLGEPRPPGVPVHTTKDGVRGRDI